MSEIDRRDFMKTAAGAAALTGAAHMIGPKTWANANEIIRVGVVGLFGRGKAHLEGFEDLENVEVTAVCDVDKNYLKSTGRMLEMKTGRKIKMVADVRELLDDPDIDVITIATPNHWHALSTIWACQAGKDVYVEKPCSHNVFEGRQAVKAARKYNRIVQMGAQSRSSVAMREGMQKLHNGEIGEVYYSKGLCYKWRPTIGKADPEPPPANLDYDMWTGPAEMEPYTRIRHPYQWHWLWNYGNGDIGNQGVHEMDKARWGLNVGMPTKISSAGGRYMFDDDQETPNTMISTFEFPEKNKLLVFEVRHWMHNEEAGMGGGGDNAVGNLFLGSEGHMVFPSYSSYQIFRGKNGDAEPLVSAGGNHWQNFIDAVRSRKVEDLNLDIEEGHISSAMCHLANISYRVGRSIHFDPATETITGDEEASKLLTRPYRAPYIVPEEV